MNGIGVTDESIEVRRHIAYVSETAMLYPSLSGFENLDFLTALALGYERLGYELLDSSLQILLTDINHFSRSILL